MPKRYKQKGKTMLKFELDDEAYFKLLKMKAELKCHTWDEFMIKLIDMVSKPIIP